MLCTREAFVLRRPQTETAGSSMHSGQRSLQKRRIAWRCESESAVIAPLHGPKIGVSAPEQRPSSTQAPEATASRHSDALCFSGGSTCPSCSHAMLRPSHAPHLLFPCGHSVCLECVSVISAHSKGSHCPCCSSLVTSSAPNVAFHQLLLKGVASTDAQCTIDMPAQDSTALVSLTNDPARCLQFSA